MKRCLIIPNIVLVSILVLMTSCFPNPLQQISWNPEGTELAYIGADSTLWIWDSRTGQCTHHAKTFQGQEIVFCKWLRLDDDILLGVQQENQMNVYKLDIPPDAAVKVADDVEAFAFDVSEDSEFLYYSKQNEETKSYEIWEKSIDHPEKEELLFINNGETICPIINPSRTRLLYQSGAESGVSFCVYDKIADATRELFTGGDEGSLWPAWVNDDRIIYLQPVKENDSLGSLCAYSFTTGATEEIASNVYVFSQPSIRPDRESVLATVFPQGREKEIEAGWLSVAQIAEIRLASGEMKLLTDEPFGAGYVSICPTGNRIAFRTPIDTQKKVAAFRILDLDKNRRHFLWRNDEERLFAAGESFLENKDPYMALAQFQDLLQKYPETEFRDFAAYYQIDLLLQQPFLNPDRAVSAFGVMNDGGLRAQTRPMLWSNPDCRADDPAEDWIRTYGTEDATKQFEFNTDLTRDLLGVSAKWGDEYLYVRIDYNSTRDLQGLVFQDTLLLFDSDSPEEGIREISPSTRWDRGAECQVWLRHWYDNEDKSQYDMEFLDEKGEVKSRFLSSGFPHPNYPYFNIVDTMQEEHGSVVMAISRKMLGSVSANRKIYLQVCTFKGGIEVHTGKELPRVQVMDGHPVCDVADAFGSENTAERLRADEAQGKPLVIRGYATCLEPAS